MHILFILIIYTVHVHSLIVVVKLYSTGCALFPPLIWHILVFLLHFNTDSLSFTAYMYCLWFSVPEGKKGDMLSLSLPNTSVYTNMQDLLRKDSSAQVDSNENISLSQSEVGIQAEKELHSSVGKSQVLA